MNADVWIITVGDRDITGRDIITVDRDNITVVFETPQSNFSLALNLVCGTLKVYSEFVSKKYDAGRS